MVNRNKMETVWKSLEPVDILITHGPPKGYLDITEDFENNKELVHVGCKSLANKTLEIRPRIHCFGHIHSERNANNYGIFQGPEGIMFVNAACFNHHASTIYNGHIIEV